MFFRFLFFFQVSFPGGQELELGNGRFWMVELVVADAKKLTQFPLIFCAPLQFERIPPLLQRKSPIRRCHQSLGKRVRSIIPHHSKSRDYVVP